MAPLDLVIDPAWRAYCFVLVYLLGCDLLGCYLGRWKALCAASVGRRGRWRSKGRAEKVLCKRLYNYVLCKCLCNHILHNRLCNYDRYGQHWRLCLSSRILLNCVVILPSKALPKGQAALLFPVAVPIRYDLTQRTPPERPLYAVSAAKVPSVHETAERAPIRGDFVVTAYTTGPAVPGVEELPLYG